MDRAAIGCQIGGVSIRIPKKPKQIVSEFGGHIIDINSDGRGGLCGVECVDIMSKLQVI